MSARRRPYRRLPRRFGGSVGRLLLLVGGAVALATLLSPMGSGVSIQTNSAVAPFPTGPDPARVHPAVAIGPGGSGTPPTDWTGGPEWALAHRPMVPVQGGTTNLGTDTAGFGPRHAGALPAGPVRPRPSNSTVQFVQGTVIDSVHGTPVPGINVSTSSRIGYACPSGNCTVKTNRSGGFTDAAPPGPVQITFSADWYLTNETWVTLPSGQTLQVGTILLVHDAIGHGRVLADRPTHPPLSGVMLVATSRDGSTTGSPFSSTVGNGTFTNLSIPPTASKIVLTPGAPGYAPNATYAQPKPWEIVDLGTLYLEGGVNVSFSLEDGTTLQPIGASVPVTVDVCSRPVLVCDTLLNLQGPGPFYASIVPGAISARVTALGYLLNLTALPDVPANVSGSVSEGTIRLVPVGGVQFTTQFTQTVAPNGTWPTGELQVWVCSGEGFTAGTIDPILQTLIDSTCLFSCVPYGSRSTVTAFPLRNVLYLSPDYTGLCPAPQSGWPAQGFPIDLTKFASPPFRLAPPWGFANMTWENVTANQVTSVGWINMTAGSFVSGRVAIAGQPAYFGPGAYSCSTDDPLVCGGAAPGPNVGAVGCPTGLDTFCVASPPGPVRVTVFGPPNTLINWTWIEVPRGCCAQQGTTVDVGLLNFTPSNVGMGNLTGSLEVATSSGVAVPYVGRIGQVTACPVLPQPGGPAATCNTTTNDATTGQFRFRVPVGWDSVAVQAPGVAPNSTWVYVASNNSTGAIVLTPLAFVAGRVVGPGDVGLPLSTVIACALSGTRACTPLGTDGLTGTDGAFNGSLPGASFPTGVYRVTASAPGYLANWTWANITPASTVVLPAIALTPFSANGTPRTLLAGPSAQPRPSGSSGAWIVGRLIDARTGRGLPGATIAACAVRGTFCSTFADFTSWYGAFNGSVPSGAYQLYLNASGYYGATAYANATSAGYVDVGVVTATAYSWLSGRVVFNPWPSLTSSGGLGPSGMGLHACDNALTTCADRDVVNSGGFFNISAPLGTADVLVLGPGGVSSDTMMGWGYGATFAPFNTTGTFTRLPTTAPGWASVDLFGALSGTVEDASSKNSANGHWNDSAAFANLEVVGTVTTGGSSAIAGPDGNFTVYVETQDRSWDVIARQAAFLTSNVTWAASVPLGVTVHVPRFALVHYGWVTATELDAVTHAPIVGGSLTVYGWDPLNLTSIIATGDANGAGFVNATAPPGVDTFNASASGYGWLTGSVTVAQSRTAHYGRVSLRANPLPDWVVLRSTYVNTVGIPPRPSVVDNLTGAPVDNAAINVYNVPLFGTTPFTNEIGQFFLATGRGPNATVEFLANGFEPNRTSYNFTTLRSLELPRVNLIGDTVLVGRVVAQPNNTPVPYVNVSVCPLGVVGCTDTVETNGTGVFWVTAPPGPVQVEVVTDLYLANQTKIVTAGSDQWMEIGNLTVFGFGTVVGAVRGLPSGFLLVNATANLCSPYSSRNGPCLVEATVATDPRGTFSIRTPPAAYFLEVSATGYNRSFLPIVVAPGRTESVGTVLLFADAALEGRVVTGTNDTPVPRATVTACGAYTSGPCTRPATTNVTGAFEMLAPPGPDQITVNAAGFEDAYVSVYARSGELATLPTIVLTPVPPTTLEPVFGTVVAAPGGPGLPGAFVGASQNGRAVTGATTDANGVFSLSLVWGVYSLRATLAGHNATRTNLTAEGPVTGLVLVLPPTEYSVSGFVVNAATRMGIGGAVLTLANETLAVSAGTGHFAFSLPNGTYLLSVQPPPSGTSEYAAALVDLGVSGAGVQREIALSPTSVAVRGTVVNAANGQPVIGARVALVPQGAAAAVATATTDGGGGFRFQAAPGAYDLVVEAVGYFVSNTTLTVTGTGGSVTVPVSPLMAAGGSAPIPWPIVGAALVAVVGGAAVLLTVLRRRRPPQRLRVYTPEEVEVVEAYEGPKDEVT